MEVIGGNKVPIFSWCPEEDASIHDKNETAFDQMGKIANTPFVKHCALMPDAHRGTDMPIGGVVGTDNVIVPNWVGVDIGCGMATFKTNLKKDEFTLDLQGELHHAVNRSIPMGFAHNHQGRVKTLKEQFGEKLIFAISKHYNNVGPFSDDKAYSAMLGQLGTLGGGNHFIELQEDEQGNVWAMVHSGSRNLGKQVGDFFNEQATEEKGKWYSVCDVPFIPVQTELGAAYLDWMRMAMLFAYQNRRAMLEDVMRNMKHYFPHMEILTRDIEGVTDDVLNIHHNYAALESHFGKNMWVHRKGATLATKNTVGIIPGAMGRNSCSYIVRGLENPKSLMSCSHGAGRVSGRIAFNVKVNADPALLDRINKTLEGVYHSEFGKCERGRAKGMLDVSEAPDAYKSIDEVMANQTDLVTPVVKLLPFMNWKDTGAKSDD